MEREIKKEAQKKWDRFWILCAVAVIGFLFWVILTRSQARTVANIQQGIAEEVIRFHVLANSDSEEDQALKMKVKEKVLEKLKVELEGVSGIDETREVIQGHLEEIKETAQNTVWEEGYDYPVTITLDMYEFPTKTYGDCTFPAGTYEALRVCIGKAEGKNWWCVVFPNLCFADTVHAVLPEEEKEELKHVLTEEEYEYVFEGESKIKISWWWAER